MSDNINTKLIVQDNYIIIDNLNKLVKQIKYDINHSLSKNNKLKNMFRLKHIIHAINIITAFPKKIIS